MAQFLEELVDASRLGGRHRGPLWQPSAWDRAIRNESEFAATVGYIARNPVEAGLCRVEEDWPYLWVAT